MNARPSFAKAMLKIDAINEAAGALFRARDWRGECFEAAYVLARSAKIDVVQGEPVGRGGVVIGHRYGHAWCEWNGLAWDLTISPDPIPVGFFYRLGCISELHLRRYNWREARKQANANHHWGPWEGPLADGPLYGPWRPEDEI